jgi:hypothetical protein
MNGELILALQLIFHHSHMIPVACTSSTIFLGMSMNETVLG